MLLCCRISLAGLETGLYLKATFRRVSGPVHTATFTHENGQVFNRFGRFVQTPTAFRVPDVFFENALPSGKI